MTVKSFFVFAILSFIPTVALADGLVPGPQDNGSGVDPTVIANIQQSIAVETAARKAADQALSTSGLQASDIGPKVPAATNGTLTTPSIVGSVSLSGVTYSTLPTTSRSTTTWYFCTDCYSKFREDGDDTKGVLTRWNGTTYVDAVGVAVLHP